MFYFLGAFATPPGDIEYEFVRLWPDVEFAVIEFPINAAAVRLTARTRPSSEGELPDDILSDLTGISAKHPKTRFLMLRADCWGGDCFYSGKTIEAGRTITDEVGSQSLRRMIQFLGADIGERQIFDPLKRDFAWYPSARADRDLS